MDGLLPDDARRERRTPKSEGRGNKRPQRREIFATTSSAGSAVSEDLRADFDPASFHQPSKKLEQTLLGQTMPSVGKY
jgi:hypothetical protein